jgi:hypothetical protein
MQFDGPEIGDYDRRNGGNFYQKDEPKAADGEFILSLGGGESASSAAERKRHAALLKAERDVKDAAGYERLLRAEFESAVQALTDLPADAQGHGFHAAWDRPVIAGEATARVKIWRGTAADDTRMVPGKNLIALQASRGRKMVIDCTRTASPERPDVPYMELSGSFAEMAMDAPSTLREWQRKVTRDAQPAHVPVERAAPLRL